MKRLLAVAVFVLFAVNAFAASSITVVPPTFESSNKTQLVITLACVAHTDGTFTSTQLTTENVRSNYWQNGYYLYEAWAINPASDYATTAAAVTITDESGAYIIKSGELTLSTDASAIVEASLEKYRTVNSKLTVAVGDTGSAANTFTLYLKFAR